MSTVPNVLAQLDKTIHAHRIVHHHAVTLAQRERAARAAIEKAGSPEAVQVPDLEPVGMPGVPVGVDPLAGL